MTLTTSPSVILEIEPDATEDNLDTLILHTQKEIEKKINANLNHEKEKDSFHGHHHSKLDGGADQGVGFAQFGLSPSLNSAIALLGYTSPTPIQLRLIPLILQGKDAIAQARTGSGKTAAYLLPCLHALISSPSPSPTSFTHHQENIHSSKVTLSSSNADAIAMIKMLILVPTSDLANQTYTMIQQFTTFQKRMNVVNGCTGLTGVPLQHALVHHPVDILIITPARLVHLLPSLPPTYFDSLRYLILDEADLLFSFGYEQDLQTLFPSLPQPSSMYQTVLISATIHGGGEEEQAATSNAQNQTEKDDKQVKRPLAFDFEAKANPCLFEPVHLCLNDTAKRLHQYRCLVHQDQDKYLLVYVLRVLHFLQGSVLLFMNDVDRCYKLQLVLANLGITAQVLNPTFPITARMHLVHLFNTQKCPLLITTDHHDPTHQGIDFSVSRGIDFHHVRVVVNVDPPHTHAQYVHRVGRTARAGASGIAVTFVHPPAPTTAPTAVAAALLRLPDLPVPSLPSLLHRFRYRFQDALRSVTKTKRLDHQRAIWVQMVRTADSLHTYFDTHPHASHEVAAWTPTTRHGTRTGSLANTAFAGTVPSYLVPKGMEVKVKQVGFHASTSAARAGKRKGSAGVRQHAQVRRGRQAGGGRGGRGGGVAGKQMDPLKWQPQRKRRVGGV